MKWIVPLFRERSLLMYVMEEKHGSVESRWILLAGVLLVNLQVGILVSIYCSVWRDNCSVQVAAPLIYLDLRTIMFFFFLLFLLLEGSQPFGLY